MAAKKAIGELERTLETANAEAREQVRRLEETHAVSDELQRQHTATSAEPHDSRRELIEERENANEATARGLHELLEIKKDAAKDGYGFTFDTAKKAGSFITSVSPGGVAAATKLMKEGQAIVSINGNTVAGMKKADVVYLIKANDHPEFTLLYSPTEFAARKVRKKAKDGAGKTAEVTATFTNGKPRIVKGVVVMKDTGEWDRFMRFMERYAQSNGLGFTKA